MKYAEMEGKQLEGTASPKTQGPGSCVSRLAKNVENEVVKTGRLALACGKRKDAIFEN